MKNRRLFEICGVAFSSLLVLGLHPLASAGAGDSASAGPGDGAGGSLEAQMFTSIARKAATELAAKAETKKYGDLLLATLDGSIEVDVVDSLKGVCDGRGEGTTDYAYSCTGKVNLLQNPWGNQPPGQGWLASEANALKHVSKIIHEVFRAAKPVQGQFYTNDPGFSATGGDDLRDTLAKMEAREVSAPGPAQCWYEATRRRGILHIPHDGIDTKKVLDSDFQTQIYQITDYIIDGVCDFDEAQKDVLRKEFGGYTEYEGKTLEVMNRKIAYGRKLHGHMARTCKGISSADTVSVNDSETILTLNSTPYVITEKEDNSNFTYRAYRAGGKNFRIVDEKTFVGGFIGDVPPGSTYWDGIHRAIHFVCDPGLKVGPLEPALYF